MYPLLPPLVKQSKDSLWDIAKMVTPVDALKSAPFNFCSEMHISLPD